jgi:hypothetical protein
MGPGQCDPDGCMPGWIAGTPTEYGLTCVRHHVH